MELNADFNQRAVVHGEQLDWAASPLAGVSRRMLDRIGGEIARATSIVRYDAGSSFSAHVHGGGEEFLVIEGVFQDEHGDYPEGAYVRNPPGSRHTPRSDAGCVILVKLWQFDPADRTEVRIKSNELSLLDDGNRPGVLVAPLFKDAREDVRLESWAPAARVRIAADGGAEVFVLEGDFSEGADRLGRYSWLRVPDGSMVDARAGDRGARVWVKTGHLRNVDGRFVDGADPG